MSRHFPFAGTFGAANDFLSNGLGGLLTSLIFAGPQQEANELAGRRQEDLFGIASGVAGIPGVEGIPSVQSPFDLSQFQPQAQGLADMLSRFSGRRTNAQLRDASSIFGAGGNLQSGLAGLPGQFAGQNQSILDQFGQGAAGITGQFQAGAADINRGFQGRLTNALGMLEGAGAQAGEDISNRFATSLSNAQQDLRARGFGGTIGANIAQASAGGESAEQRRLQEQLRQQRLGVFSQLSGEALGAQQGLLGAGANLQAGFLGQGLGAAQGGQQFLGGLNLNAMGQQAQLAQFLQQTQGQLSQQDLSNQFQFGQLPINTGLQAGSTVLGALGPFDIRPPQQLNFADILP